jgi:hypothetical protein
VGVRVNEAWENEFAAEVNVVWFKGVKEVGIPAVL